MADPLEFEFKAEGDRKLNDALDRTNKQLDELEKQTDETADAQGRMGDQTQQTGGMLGKFKGNAVAAGAAIAGVAVALNKAFKAAQGFFNEFERQAGIINRFTGDISDASDRVNGLVSDLELMEAQNKLSRAGVELTAEEFGSLTVAATELAAATGGDATEGINKLVNAVARGQAGVLKELGVDVTTVTDVTEKQSLAISELNNKYGDAESSADTLGGQLDTLSVALENAKTDFFEIASQIQETEAEVSALGDATDNLAESLGVAESDITAAEAAGATFQAVLAEMVEGVADLVDAFADLLELDFAGFAESFSDAFLSPFDLFLERVPKVREELRKLKGIQSGAIQEEELGDLPSEEEFFSGDPGKLGVGDQSNLDRSIFGGGPEFGGTRNRSDGGGGRGGGGSRGPRFRGDPAEMDLDQLERQFEDENRIEQARERQRQAMKVGPGFEDSEGLGGAASQAVGEFRELEEISAQLEKTLGGVADTAKEFGERSKQIAAIWEDEMVGGIESTIGMAGDLTELIVRGQEEQIAAFLKTKAISYGIQAGEQFALYLSKQFVPGRQAEAAGHLASSVKFISLAALAGGGAGIASAAGGGGGNAGASGDGEQDRDRGGGGEFGGGEAGGGPTTIVVNVDPAGTPADRLGRVQQRWQREASKLDQRRSA